MNTKAAMKIGHRARHLAAGIGLTAALLPGAFAHVTLENGQAAAGSYFKAVLQVPHGCKGSPTVALRVRLPEDVVSVKPQPKPGWTLTITRVKLAQPVQVAHGNTATERVSEIEWAGGLLPDDQFDEFKLVMKLPERPDTTLYLPVVQQCKDGLTRWIEIPEAGKSAAEPKEPAPAIRLTPKH